MAQLFGIFYFCAYYAPDSARLAEKSARRRTPLRDSISILFSASAARQPKLQTGLDC